MLRRRIPGYKTYLASKRWLRSRWRSRLLILGYHRVAALGSDPFNMAVHPDYFQEQLAQLKQMATVIPLAEAPRLLRQANPGRRLVALTFDDGYQDSLTTALPLLAHYQLPATFFITTGNLAKPFWWDELAYWFRDATQPGATITLRGKQFTRLTMADLLLPIYQQLLLLPAEARNEGLAELQTQLGPAQVKARALSRAELQQLASAEFVHIGAHTVTHPQLNQLTTAEQKWELRSSRHFLSELLDRPVQALSYPNGAADNVTRALARKAGYTLACGSQPDMVLRDDDPLWWPRFWVPNISGRQLRRWLSLWL